MASKNKFYVVWKGKVPGVYGSWEECKRQISGIKGAQYMGFADKELAEKAYNSSYAAFKGQKKKKEPRLTSEELIRIGEPNLHSIAVDAASSGNPGKMEYQGVDTKTGKRLFKQGPFPEGTNNIGEFLAIVHGLAFLKERRSDRVLYSDSRTAISWVRKKRCNTKLEPNPRNRELFDLVERAEKWLQKNSYTTPIVKWETLAWGEIPADFGRK
ncbi:ribonuclease HI [Muriicola jejuensis]|uniref:Ribonuclease H n=1 Tax=Muriicola jejuensis TaxID=504488 RepID=A0A6P0UC88_9FLAO|nr:ribonuclease H family protein [Muriicola jejuensis]NER10110.1 ribonuclease H [Muriicola jejuensis]SMP02868.1 ribonuclease HI [Muriicola jejuensis]